MAPYRKEHVLNTIISRAKSLSFKNPQEYMLHILNHKKGFIEWEALLDSLLIKETVFFRDKAAMELVRQYLAAQFQLASNTKQSIQLWSLGCATGEEAYSLAAIARDCSESFKSYPYYGVTGTDLSQSAIDFARKGVYSARSVRLIDKLDRSRYFDQPDLNHYRVKSSISKRVCFIKQNLLSIDSSGIQPMDIIYCQNVFIYLRRWRRKQVLNQLVEHLKPGGILVIGPAEITDWGHDLLQRMSGVETQAYRKVASSMEVNQ